MHYYQRMYGDAFVDLCEQGLARFKDGGSLVGISSPGCTLQYKANLGYDMPGSGKCVMEYTMRLFAVRAATKNVNVNVVIPGVTVTACGASSGAAHVEGGDRRGRQRPPGAHGADAPRSSRRRRRLPLLAGR